MNHGWEKKRLGDLCAYHRGLTYSKDDEVEKSSKSVLRANNINLETSTLNLDELKYLREDFYIAPKYLLSKDSILICMSSGSKSHLGKVAFIDKDSDYAFGGFMGLIIPKTNARFLYLFMTSPFFRSHLQKITNGININNLKFSTLQDLFVPVPAADVQTKIVTELDRIKALIEIKRNQLKDLDTLAQSLFYDFFGDPISNPKGWEIRPLKDAVIEMFLGPFGSALKTDCYVPEEDSFAMVYEQKHAIKKTLAQDNHFIDESKFHALKRFEVLPLDFIMSCRGTIGQLYQVPENAPRGIIHPSVMKIRLNSSTYNSVFFQFLLPVIIKEQQTKGNCVQMAITAKELGAKRLPVPPLALQEKFAARIEQIEAEKKHVEATIAELQTLLASRMDYWFN